MEGLFPFLRRVAMKFLKEEKSGRRFRRGFIMMTVGLFYGQQQGKAEESIEGSLCFIHSFIRQSIA